MYFKSGAADWFVSETSGYVKIVARHAPGDLREPRYVDIEHRTLLLTTITCWGIASELSP